MSHARVDMRFTTVHKVYPPAEREQWQREIFAYTNLDFATPALDGWGDCWLEMERCAPILELLPEQSVKYRQGLRDLLARLHEAGWWHRDVDLVNVVIHPARGPLLIDFENLTRAEGPVSYDLYGAQAAGMTPWPGKGLDGVHWHGPTDTCPGRYWEGL